MGQLFLEAWLAPVLQLLIAMVLGAMLFRMRGAAGFRRITGRGKTTADAAWALTMAAITAAPSLWQLLALAAALWLGGRPGWWQSLTLGRCTLDGSTAAQWTRHTARGVFWIAPAAAVAWWVGASPWPLLVAGLLCAPAYEAGWRADGWQHLGGTEWGELLFGATLGAALVVAFKFL